MSAAPTPQTVLSAFAAVDREISFERAEGVVRHIKAWGANARLAVSGLDGPTQSGLDYLAYETAKDEAHNPALVAKRLNAAAEDAYANAVKHLTLSVEYAGRAQFKRSIKDNICAAELQATAEAELRCHNECDAQGFALSLRAVEYELRARRIAYTQEIAAALGMKAVA